MTQAAFPAQPTPKAERSPTERLWLAVRKGARDSARAAIGAGASVDDIHPESHATPLSFACSNDDAKLAHLLLDMGADPSVRHSEQPCILASMMSSGLAHREPTLLARLLADPRVDPNEPSVQGIRPLHALTRARGYDPLEAARLLLRAGANPALTDDRGESALDSAIHMNIMNYELLEILATPGAATRAAPHGNALMLALSLGRCALVPLLAPLCDPATRNAAGETALHLAADLTEVDIETLASLRGDPWAKDGNGRTPLRILATNPSGPSQDVGGQATFLAARLIATGSPLEALREISAAMGAAEVAGGLQSAASQELRGVVDALFDSISLDQSIRAPKAVASNLSNPSLRM